MSLLRLITRPDMLKKPIAITLGDPAGIGPEIIAKAFTRAPELTQDCFVVGDVATMRRALQWVSAGQIPMVVALIESAEDAHAVPAGCLPVLQVGSPMPLVPVGELSAQAGKLAAVERGGSGDQRRSLCSRGRGSARGRCRRGRKAAFRLSSCVGEWGGAKKEYPSSDVC